MTSREEDYLEYFTQFCRYTEDPIDYGIDTAAGAEEKELFTIPEKPPEKNVRERN